MELANARRLQEYARDVLFFHKWISYHKENNMIIIDEGQLSDLVIRFSLEMLSL